MNLTTPKLSKLVESVMLQEQIVRECQVLTEASLGRVLNKYFDIGFMVITADRTCEAEKGTACTEQEIAEQTKINKQNEEALKSDLASAGFGFIPTYGGFRERVVDPDTGEEKLIDNPEPELSFIVPAQKRGSKGQAAGDSQELKQLGMELSAKYNQDSFLFKSPASEDSSAYWITRTGEEEMSFDDVVANDLEQIYFTKLRKKPGRFSLTEDQQFALYIPKSPKSVAEARRRYGEIFIRVEKI
jgi:hypothetical protein